MLKKYNVLLLIVLLSLACTEQTKIHNTKNELVANYIAGINSWDVKAITNCMEGELQRNMYELMRTLQKLEETRDVLIGFVKRKTFIDPKKYSALLSNDFISPIRGKKYSIEKISVDKFKLRFANYRPGVYKKGSTLSYLVLPLCVAQGKKGWLVEGNYPNYLLTVKRMIKFYRKRIQAMEYLSNQLKDNKLSEKKIIEYLKNNIPI